MIEIISLIFMFIGLFLFLYSCFIRGSNKVNKETIESNYAILIPARNESNVIENLLISITKQTFKIDNKNVYVIVEEKNDPTVAIVDKYNMNVVYRKDLFLRRKGYALADAVEEILANGKKYDAYFIMDADNVLDKDYIYHMDKSIQEGYDIATGYRNCKNGNKSVTAACSALTFSMINVLGNKGRIKNNKTITISGTGFYIKGYLIDKWRTYPFHSLTEDYELTLYATLNNLSTTYNDKAVFYDEQPVDFNISKIQRTRWIKGYFEARSHYIPLLKKKNIRTDEIIGVNSFIIIVIGIILFIINQFIYLFIDFKIALIKLLAIFIVVILLIMIATLTMLIRDKNLKLTKKMKLKCLFFNVIFLISYVECAIKALLIKNIKWDAIKHGN